MSPCLVVIDLKRTELQLTTSAAHALEILSGQTVLPAKGTKVFDADGKRLKRPDLVQLQENDEASQLNLL